MTTLEKTDPALDMFLRLFEGETVRCWRVEYAENSDPFKPGKWCATYDETHEPPDHGYCAFETRVHNNKLDACADAVTREYPDENLFVFERWLEWYNTKSELGVTYGGECGVECPVCDERTHIYANAQFRPMCKHFVTHDGHSAYFVSTRRSR